MEHAKGSDAEIQGNVLKSGMLNGVSLISIWVFEFLLGLASRRHGSQSETVSEKGFIHRNIGWFYQALWLSPIVGASLYLNVSQDLFSPTIIALISTTPSYSPRGVMSSLDAHLSSSMGIVRSLNNNQSGMPECSIRSQPARTGQ
jgi:hypothetical protein